MDGGRGRNRKNGNNSNNNNDMDAGLLVQDEEAVSVSELDMVGRINGRGREDSEVQASRSHYDDRALARVER